MNSKEIFDKSFNKNTYSFHPTIIPFPTAMELNDINKNRSTNDKDKMSDDDDNNGPTD